MRDYDVIVAGGGIGGFSAAIGAAKSGARVLLIEKYGFLGGVATSANVLAFCGLYQSGADTPVPATSGASDILFEELGALGLDTRPQANPNTGNWLVLLEPERLKLAMDRCLVAHGVDTLLHTRVTDARLKTASISELALSAHEGNISVAGNAFVDATGDAHIAKHIASGEGAPRSSRLQPYSAPIRIGGLPEGLTIDRQSLAIEVQRYNEAGGSYPIHRPRGGYFAQVPGSTDIWWLVIDYPCETATSHELTRAEGYVREAAQDYVQILRRVQPETSGATLVQTGPQLGIRESWHARTRDQITTQDLLDGRLREDAIARAAWPMEDHAIMGQPTFTPLGGAGFAHIPFGAIRSAIATNLYFSGRTIGADPLAFTSIRVMGTAFATGFAAGVAAASQSNDANDIAKEIRKKGGLI